MAMLYKRKLNLSFDTTSEDVKNISDFYDSQLTGRKSTPSPDPVRKGSLDLSSTPKKTFGNYIANNPKDSGSIEDRRDTGYFNKPMEKIGSDLPKTNWEDYSKNMEAEGNDEGPAGLKSGQSRKTSPEEAIDKTFNRR